MFDLSPDLYVLTSPELKKLVTQKLTFYSGDIYWTKVKIIVSVAILTLKFEVDRQIAALYILELSYFDLKNTN